jgi:hypothetical protein
MKTLRFVAPIFAVAVLASAYAFTPVSVKTKSTANPPLHITMANELVDGILNQASNKVYNDASGNQTNRYGGAVGTYSITFATPAVPNSIYSNFTRCAPFLTQLLKAAYNWTPPQSMGNSPDPKKYYNAITKNLNGFAVRSDFSDWEVGDILVSPYFDPGANNIGHVMLMLDAAEISSDPATKTKEYLVQVLDSSGDLHTQDTRTLHAKLNQGGVGRGIIRVKTVDDVITQWAWNATTAYYSGADRPLALGWFVQ